MPLKGPRPHTRGPRPHVWKIGPDPELHAKYRVWLQQRNQALWRGEGWHIDFDVWCEIWGDQWHNRGRERGTMCMTRRDWSEPWTEDNAIIVTRSQHARAQGHAKAAGWRSLARQRQKEQQ